MHSDKKTVVGAKLIKSHFMQILSRSGMESGGEARGWDKQTAGQFSDKLIKTVLIFSPIKSLEATGHNNYG